MNLLKRILLLLSIFLLVNFILEPIDAAGATGFRVYYGDFEYGTGTSKDVSIGGTVNVSHTFLVMYMAGTSTVNEPEEGSVTGYIYNETHLRFEKVDSIAGTWVSWFVVEAMDEEFTVRARDQITMSSAQTSNTGSISGVQDVGQCTVHSNFRSEGDAAAEWDAATSRTEITASNTVTAYRYTTDSQPAYVRYEVIEWDSDYNVYNGTLTMSGASDTDLISGLGNPGDATINMSRSILFATWDQPHRGLRCANLNYNISNTNEVTFAHYSTTTYTKDVTWYLVEFPADQAPEIQTWSYFWAPTTSPGNVKTNSMNEVNTSHTFLASWSTTVSGTGIAYMRAFNLPRLVNSTAWSETQYNPASQTYDDHDTTAAWVKLPYLISAGDSAHPKITVIEPANNSAKSWTHNITINGTASDNNPDSIFVNDTRFTWNGTYASWKLENNTAIGTREVFLNITANDTSGNQNSTYFNLTLQALGSLNVILDSPTGTNDQPQNNTFELKANVTCIGQAGATCSTVNGTIWYNITADSDTPIQGNDSYATPFYTIESNPQTCGAMSVNDECNLTWTINTTGTIGDNYKLDVSFNSSSSDIASNRTDFTTINIIAPTFSITISDELADVKFNSSLIPGATNSAALNNSADEYYITCNNPLGNCNISIKSNSNMQSGVSIIKAGNVSWSTTNNPATETALTSNYEIINETLAHLANQLIYFWIDIPTGQSAGIYKSNFTIQGQQN